MTFSTFQKLTATAALAASIGLAALGGANAQSTPGLSYGQVPTPAQWNGYFAAKQDVLGYTPCNTAGCTMTGRLNAVGSTAAQAGFNIGVGVAPTSPVNGDMWATFSGIYVYLNSTVIGPLTSGTSGSFAAAAPLTVSFSGGVVTYGIAGELLAANNLSDVANAATALSNLGGAPKASPAFTGTPTAPTQTTGDSSTKIATDAFVQTAVGNASVGTPSPQGRLTLATVTPVMTSTQSAIATVYYTPYVGNSIPLWNGSAFAPTTFSELTNVLANSATGNAGPAAAVASSAYDLFVWSNAGTPTLTRGPAWTSATTRSLTLSRVSGLLVNAAAITNGPGSGAGTYVGSVFTDSSGATVTWNEGSSASGGGAAFLDVWNEFNRVNVVAKVLDTGTAYTYTSSTIRQARGSTGNQINFFSGEPEEAISVVLGATNKFATASGAVINIGVALDTTTSAANIAPAIAMQSQSTIGAVDYRTVAGGVPPLTGSHFIASLESSDGTNANTFDNGADNTLTASLRM